MVAGCTLDDPYRDIGMIPEESSHQLMHEAGGD
jgi:hypothetical protein